MKYAYYNSCSLRSTGREYDKSLRAVFKKLDIELVEPKNWICCGSTLAHNVSRLLSLALPLQNLAEIQKEGFDAVVVPCTACYSRFKIAQYEIAENSEMAAEVEEVIEYRFEKKVKVLHPLEVLSSEPVISRLPELVEKDLSSLKVVSYYGCLMLRPPEIMEFDICEYPQTMDKILNAVGIPTLDWSHKTECCGGSLSITRPEIVRKLSRDLLEDAKAVGAEAISVPCTFCHLNLDVRQEEIEKEHNVSYRLPILYFTELVALAMGVPERDLLLKMHFVDSESVLQKVVAR
ncbi:MAG: CoB--CoM heterodisulfide reductase iron-sulfur subunit B family protein [Dehalococcoidales bacterium]